MAWFTKKEESPPELLPDIWHVCSKCGAHIFKDSWENNLKVCPKCGHHDRLSARERIELLVDPGTFREYGQEVVPTDHLGFADAKGSYAAKAAGAVKKLGIGEAVVTGSGNVEGIRVVFAVMDFAFLGGSLSSGAGEKIDRAIQHAIDFNRTFVMVSASGGARMHEGILSLMQMAKTSAAVGRVKEAGLPYISVLTDPTTGGVSASYAMLGDINVTEPKALIGFAGRRVIENTIHQKLPPDFQSAEYLLAHGFIDKIVERKDLKAFIVKMLRYFGFGR